MASGWTTSSALADSIPVIIAGARNVNENEGAMTQLADVQTLKANTGDTYYEISHSRQTATAVTETTDNDNFQQLDDTLLSVKTSMVQYATLITDKVKRNLSSNSLALLGDLAMNAMVRKMDLDGLLILSGASTVLSSAGNTFISGYVAAAGSRIASNATDPGLPPIYAVLHGYHIKDIWDELTAAVGTAAIPEGLTARVYTEGFRGNIANVKVFEDGNMPVNSSSDATGGVFAKRGVLLIKSLVPRVEAKREPGKGGGAEALYLTADYAFGERSPGNWVYGIIANATAPTS